LSRREFSGSQYPSISLPEGGQTMKQLVALAVAVCLCLSTSMVIADQYLVVKDKNGKCKVEIFRADKGKIIAGPFDSKEEVTKALHKNCPETVKKPAKKKTEKK
jgi:hypothetical protein